MNRLFGFDIRPNGDVLINVAEGEVLITYTEIQGIAEASRVFHETGQR